METIKCGYYLEKTNAFLLATPQCTYKVGSDADVTRKLLVMNAMINSFNNRFVQTRIQQRRLHLKYNCRSFSVLTFKITYHKNHSFKFFWLGNKIGSIQVHGVEHLYLYIVQRKINYQNENRYKVYQNVRVVSANY